eukprot:jgi/Mesvir1/16258/Mv08505-RA.2
MNALGTSARTSLASLCARARNSEPRCHWRACPVALSISPKPAAAPHIRKGFGFEAQQTFLDLPGNSRHSATAFSRQFCDLALSRRRDFSQKASRAVMAYGANDDLQQYIDLANKLADLAGEVILKYFRSTKFQVDAKSDESPVTIADREAEQVMRAAIIKAFPSHSILGEEDGVSDGDGSSSEYLWVLDPIDGTKSFVTGKPLFGTLIALLRDGKPVLGVIDQPYLRERWVGAVGQRTTWNGAPISTRPCDALKNAFMYTTTPHMFNARTMPGFVAVRDQVRYPLYGCDCYAYGLLAAGHVDVVLEADLKPYDFVSLVTIIEGAGGRITDWSGNPLHWRKGGGECRLWCGMALTGWPGHGMTLCMDVSSG